MSDFQKYKVKRMKQNPEFWKGHEERYEDFKLSAENFLIVQEALDNPPEPNEDLVAAMRQYKSGS